MADAAILKIGKANVTAESVLALLFHNRASVAYPIPFLSFRGKRQQRSV